MNNRNQNITLQSNEINNTNSTQRNNEENIKLEVLSPLDKKDDFRVKKYLKHIKDAIDNEDVKNLALSGVYGSGKSTIIKSFKSLYSDIKILHISLASFIEIKDTDYKDFKDQIQLNILQQIIYSQKADKLPESRINRITETNIWNKNNWINMSSILGILISTYTLLSFYKFQLNPNNWYLSNTFGEFFTSISWSFIVLILILLISLFFGGQLIIKSFINSKINKISLSGEAELGKKDDNKDILNKHIDEIIYFFEKIHIDVVVIEDLDRFNTTEIYRTLREVNFLINTYLENLEQNNLRKITFLYAIKDDLFLNELDRTKFFDLIIPAIPFVNYSNSKNVLSSKLDEIFKNERVFEKPSKEFINTVSTFITDNRTLLNILNEFIIFKEQQKLEQEELNPENLLAIVIYKNLRPKDFSKLHISLSNIDVVFKNKEKLIKSLIDEIRNKITKIKQEIEVIKKDNLNSIKELNTIFLYHIREEISNSNVLGLFIGQEKQSFKNIVDSTLNLDPLYSYIKYFLEGYPYEGNLRGTLKTIENTVGYSYSKKYDSIINKDKDIQDKEKSIKEWREKLADIENWNLEEIIKTKNYSEESLRDEFNKLYKDSIIEEKERAHNDPLLIFLLENGYINEHYKDYISIFQKGGLTESDYEFKINLISKIHEPKPIDYELHNIDDIIQELPTKYFRNSRILNINLLDTLVISKNLYLEKFHGILFIISQWNNDRIKEFLSLYIYRGSQKDKFIIELANNWNNFWTVINSDTTFIETDKKQILQHLLTQADYNTLISLNHEFQLSNYISNNVSILFDFETDNEVKRITDILSINVLNIKINEIITFPEKSQKLFNFIYENNRYTINKNNIGIIIEQKLDTGLDLESFSKSNLSYIYECEVYHLDELINYIEDDNFNSYIDNVYSNLIDEQYDDESFILKILNNEILEADKKMLFLEKQNNVIKYIGDLKTAEVYNLVIQMNKVEATWKNVYEHYRMNFDTFSENLNTFINKIENCSDLISESKMNIDIENEIRDIFIEDLLFNNEIELNRYEDIIHNCIPTDFKLSDDFEVKIINKEKIEVLIDNGIIPLTKNNYEKIKANHPDLHIELLLKDWNYLENINEFQLAVEDKTLLLTHYNLDNNSKLDIIKNSISSDDLNDETLASEIVYLVLNNPMPLHDLIDFNKLKIILSHNFSDEQKVKLVNSFGDNLTKRGILDIQNLLSEEYHTSPKSELMLENTPYNIQYINLLQTVNIAGTSKPAKNNRIRVWLNDFSK
ncbi:hypothetical protein [Chryseobacterium arthrosphaerae]|uniref:YobI family P-loop NTPase n=1 Tax=Chryseobacterium arthrosphaerae TaxID=651561 RepID=UPI003D34E7B9